MRIRRAIAATTWMGACVAAGLHCSSDTFAVAAPLNDAAADGAHVLDAAGADALSDASADPTKVGVGVACPKTGLPFCDDFDLLPVEQHAFVPPWDEQRIGPGNAAQRVASTATPPYALRQTVNDVAADGTSFLLKRLLTLPGRVYIGFDAKASAAPSVAQVPIAGFVNSTRALGLMLASGGTSLSILDAPPAGGAIVGIPLPSGRVPPDHFVHVTWLVDSPARTSSVWIDGALAGSVVLPERPPGSGDTGWLLAGSAAGATGNGQVVLELDNVRVIY